MINRLHKCVFYLFIYSLQEERNDYLKPTIMDQTVCASDSKTMSVLGSA